MNEDQKCALLSLVRELREYVEQMSAAVFIPNNTQDLLKSCDKVESEFRL